MTLDLLIKNAEVVSHKGIEKADIAIRDGIIVAIGQIGDVSTKTEIDVTGLHILPGVIDTDVQIRSGGDNVMTVSRAAVMGGVTSFFLNSDGQDFFKAELLNAHNTSLCDFAYFQQANENNLPSLNELEDREGCAGVSIMMSSLNGHDVIADDKTLFKVMENGKRRVVVHAGKQDEKASIDATRRIMAIAKGAGRKLHLQHVALDKEMAMIAANKELVTAAISSHHLSLDGKASHDHFGPYASLEPPLREEENRIGLWKSLSGGIADMIASYHDPHSTDDKEKTNGTTGSPAIQTMLPLMLDQVNNGSLSLLNLMDLTSAGPARTFGVAGKGRIAVGYDADFTLIDLKKKWLLEDDMVESACGWELHAGCEFTGKVKGTIVRGKTIMWNDEIFEQHKGQAIRFQDTFKAYKKE